MRDANTKKLMIDIWGVAARLGSELTVLVPYRRLPTSAATGEMKATANLYLINNEDMREGKVTVGGMVPLGFDGDSVGAFSRGIFRTAAPASLVETFEVPTGTPDGYLLHSFVVPREDAAGERLQRGTYTLGIEILSGDAVVAGAMINDLEIE